MFGAAHRLAAMEAKWQRDRLVWISNKKIVELGTNPSDKMLHKTVLVKSPLRPTPLLLGIEKRRARKVAPTTVSEKVTSNKVSRMAS